MNEWPTRVRNGVPPASVTISGTASEVIRLWITTGSRPAARSLATSRTATIAVTALGLTGPPSSSTTKQRSASPSKASPRSAPCSTTAACRSRRFSGSSGLASWFGKLPSSSKYSGTSSIGRGSRPAARPSTAGTVWPAIPLPASTTTLRRRPPERSTSPRRCSA